MTMYMETTKIPVEKTVSEIQMLLGRYGACGVMTQFENGEVSAVFFKIQFIGKELPFRLPCRYEPILNKLREAIKRPRENTEAEILAQAKRIAWRQILRWVEAQLALVDTDMVKVQEVFLPYMQTSINQTLYEKIEAQDFKAIGYSQSEI